MLEDLFKHENIVFRGGQDYLVQNKITKKKFNSKLIYNFLMNIKAIFK